MELLCFFKDLAADTIPTSKFNYINYTINYIFCACLLKIFIHF